MRRITALAAAALCAAILLPATSAAAKGHARLFGVNYTFNELRGKDLRKMDDGKVKSVRWTLFWPQVERSNGRFDWSVPDEVIGGLASRGVRVLPVLFGSPTFVAKHSSTPPLGNKQAREAWQDFLTQVVKRYGTGGSFWSKSGAFAQHHAGKGSMPVKAWQIWNEPNLKSHFRPRPSPKKYGRLLKISRGPIKSVNSGASVVFAGMPGYSNDINAWRFLDRTYKGKGVAHAFDAAALHPYSANLHQLKQEVKRTRRVMRQHGDRRKPLWITEIGWGSAHPDRYGLSKGKKGQKRMLKRSFKLLKSKQGSWHIPRVFWFDFRDPKRNSPGCSFCGSAGLLKHNYKPKPAWHAYRRFTR